LFHVDVARFVSFAAKKEKAVAADAKNFWHARELYSCDIGTNKDFGGRGPPLLAPRLTQPPLQQSVNRQRVCRLAAETLPRV